MEVGRPGHDLFHHFVASHSPWLSVQCALPQKIPRGMVTKRLADLAMTLPIKSMSAILYLMQFPPLKVGRRGYKQVRRRPYDTFGHILLHLCFMLGILCTLAPSGIVGWFISTLGDATMNTLIKCFTIFQSCWASRVQWH